MLISCSPYSAGIQELNCRLKDEQFVYFGRFLVFVFCYRRAQCAFLLCFQWYISCGNPFQPNGLWHSSYDHHAIFWHPWLWRFQQISPLSVAELMHFQRQSHKGRLLQICCSPRTCYLDEGLNATPNTIFNFFNLSWSHDYYDFKKFLKHKINSNKKCKQKI